MKPLNWTYLISEKEEQKLKPSSLSLSTVSGSTEIRAKERPRRVVLHKKNDGYGFHLKQNPDDPLHLIHHVEEGSSADKAGLKKGDCLACVNGVDVMHFSHDDCIIEIIKSGSSVELTVTSMDLIKIFYRLEISPTSEENYSWLFPNESVFAYKNKAYEDSVIEDGDFAYESDEKGSIHVSLQAKKDNFAKQSHCDSENGETGSCEPLQTVGIASMPISMQELGSQKKYFQKLLPKRCEVISVEHHLPTSLSFNLCKDGNGFGFLTVYDTAKHIHFVHHVEPQSAAEKAGLKIGDKVMSIDDKLSNELSAEELQNLIFSNNSDQLTLTISRKSSASNSG